MLSEQREFETPRAKGQMSWLAVGVVVVAAGVLTWVVLSRRTSNDQPMLDPDVGPNHPAVGRRLVTLELQPLTGDAAELSADDLQGRVTLLNFWGPWCPPCQVEFPHLVELEQHFRPRADFRFVSVSCSNEPGADEHMAEETTQFLRRERADFPTYRDADGTTREAILELVGQFAYPTTLLVGREGDIRAVWVGYASGMEQQMRQVVEEVLSEPVTDSPASE
jgi:thiol-disulfide isomerase/thioredoxin